MSNSHIFISYRREDAAGYARAIYDQLVQHFSKERVFMDVEAIEPGLPFDEAIDRALGHCKVLLVVIGRRWTDAQAGMGSRLHDPQDFVRLELATALVRNLHVIPVLFDGASMPSPDALPEPLRALARRNAFEVSNSRFLSDTERLIVAVRRALGESGVRDTLRAFHRNLPIWSWVGGGLAVGVLSVLVSLHPPLPAHTPPLQPPHDITKGAQPPPPERVKETRPDINSEWAADVTYDWPNARYVETFTLRGAGDAVYGTAAFLGIARGILAGSLTPDGLQFSTKTQEVHRDWNNPLETVHHYHGKLVGDTIQFVMQTEGGYSAHKPIEFIAKKVASIAPTARPMEPSRATHDRRDVLCPRSTPAASRVVKELGRLEADDDLNRTTYNFVICEERNTAEDTLEVRIYSGWLTGTRWEREEAAAMAATMKREGTHCLERGAPYGAGKNDKRRVHYLLCQSAGKPVAVAIHVTTLQSDGTPYPEKHLVVDWPQPSAP